MATGLETVTNMVLYHMVEYKMVSPLTHTGKSKSKLDTSLTISPFRNKYLHSRMVGCLIYSPLPYTGTSKLKVCKTWY